jgi:hypothetical protein
VNPGYALIAVACALIVTGQGMAMAAGGCIAAVAVLFFGEVRS